MLSTTHALKAPRNEFVGIEPVTSGGPNDPLHRYPPIYRGIAGAILSLDRLWLTADAACAPVPVMAELNKAHETLHALHLSYLDPNSALRKHMQEHGLADVQGFEPGSAA